MTNFNYFTLAPHAIDESTLQYKFEGGIEAVGNASDLLPLNLEYRFVYDSENEENEASPWQPYSVGDTITNQDTRWFGVQFRNNAGKLTNNSNNYYHIKSTYDFDAGGKIMSLIDYMNDSAGPSPYEFNSLFRETKIHDAHELILPDHISEKCYLKMFSGCKSLTTAPSLPATTLADRCYQEMFYGCTSLTTAPALPATTLANSCYIRMFYGCTSLTTAPALPATTLADRCYQEMFSGCTSLTTAPALPATTLANYCYIRMFNGCTSLTTAPALPATTLAGGCYQEMFINCKKIDHIVWKSSCIPSSIYCNSWLMDTSASGKFEYTDPTLDVASISRDYSGVPAGWSISLLSPETKLLLKINNASVDNISLFGKKIASLSINGKKVKSSSAA